MRENMMLITHSKFEACTLLSFGWQSGDLPGHYTFLLKCSVSDVKQVYIWAFVLANVAIMLVCSIILHVSSLISFNADETWKWIITVQSLYLLCKCALIYFPLLFSGCCCRFDSAYCYMCIIYWKQFPVKIKKKRNIQYCCCCCFGLICR